jgi:hypothetical protein
VWAAELKEIAAAYLSQAEREHASAAALEQDSPGYPPSADAEGWLEDDQNAENSATAEVFAFPEFQELGPDMDDDAIARVLGADEQEEDGLPYACYGHDLESGLVLDSEFFADGEKVGDVGKLRQLHSIIYGRVQTPDVVNGLRQKLGLFDGPANEATREMTHLQNWARRWRWAHVNKPSRKEWERFKAAR